MTLRLTNWYFRFLEDRNRDTEIHGPDEIIELPDDESRDLIAAKKAEQI